MTKEIISWFLMTLSATSAVLGQGRVTFENSSQTPISTGGSLMPVRGTEEFIFAIFLASPATVDTSGITPAFTNPAFQIVDPDAYATNSLFNPGRISSRTIYIGEGQGFVAGSRVDLVVRGWSANAGYQWADALANWNNGFPLVPMFIGSSAIANDWLLLGGTLPNVPIFGTAPDQLQGFNMVFVPEPSALVLAVLGGAVLWARLRRRKRDPRSKSIAVLFTLLGAAGIRSPKGKSPLPTRQPRSFRLEALLCPRAHR